ncbi:MAG: hypothetical protein Q9169_001275 [Polycauliona sp. 2 TL-2023]
MEIYGLLKEGTKLVLQLYQPASPQEISQTEKALQEIQRSDTGWHMADVLLGSEDANVRFFGALTFTVKINCDWESLKEGEVEQLLHQLVTWLTLRVKSNETPLVVKKLCTALVAYFLRSSASWQRCLLHLICSLSEEECVNYELMMSQHYELATRVVTSLGAPQLLAAMWFATTLVQEVGRTSLENRLTSVRQRLRVHTNLDDFVQLMRTVMTLPKAESNPTLVEESIKCFQVWAIYSYGAWPDRSGQLGTLIPYMAPPLWDLDFFEVAADCWTDLLEVYGQLFPSESMEHLETFLKSPNAQDLLHLIVKGEYDPDAMAYSRLLLTYGEVKMADLARQSNSASGMILLESLIQLLGYEGFAGAEDDVCTPAMEFWQAYTEFLVDEVGTTDDQLEPWMDSARQYLVRVLERCWIKIRIPTEEIYAQWTSEAKGDFMAFRTDVVDLLQSAFALLGSSILSNFAQLALDALQKQEWLQLEATLFCLNALAESVSDEDTADATLSTLFASEIFVAITNGVTNIPSKTQQTAVNLIISFSSFFERHSQFLLPMLNFLFVAVRTPAIAVVAGKAILSTADSARKSLVTEIDAFLEQFDELLTSGALEPVSQRRIFGATAAVIQAIPSEQQKLWSLSRILAFVGREVEQCVECAVHQAPVQAEEKGLRVLDCLVSIGKYLQEPDDSPIDLESKPVRQDELYLETKWTPSQQRVVEYMFKVQGALGTDNGDVTEAICQIFRTGFRESFPGPFVFSPMVIEDFIAETQVALYQIVERYGPQVTQAVIRNIAGEAVRSELENWANPLRQMVSTQVRSKQWIKEALFSNSLPSSKVGDAEKRYFLDQVMQ